MVHQAAREGALQLDGPGWLRSGEGGAVGGFTSRQGGVSTGALASLNLALRAGERPEHLHENWARAVGALDAGILLGGPPLGPEAVAVLDQVHGDRVIEVVAAGGHGAPVGTADAAFTRQPRIVLAVRVADCVPVVITGPGVVAVAHAGWRGTVGRVVERVVSEIVAAGVPAETLSAAVGPCISAAAYPVGDEVVAGLRSAGVPEAVFLSRRGAQPHADLRASVRWQLERAGVQRVWVSERCTVADPGLFSHRRDGDGAGRFAGLVVRLR